MWAVPLWPIGLPEPRKENWPSSCLLLTFCRSFMDPGFGISHVTRTVECDLIHLAVIFCSMP